MNLPSEEIKFVSSSLHTDSGLHQISADNLKQDQLKSLRSGKKKVDIFEKKIKLIVIIKVPSVFQSPFPKNRANSSVKTKPQPVFKGNLPFKKNLISVRTSFSSERNDSNVSF